MKMVIMTTAALGLFCPGVASVYPISLKIAMERETPQKKGKKRKSACRADAVRVGSIVDLPAPAAISPTCRSFHT